RGGDIALFDVGHWFIPVRAGLQEILHVSPGGGSGKEFGSLMKITDFWTVGYAFDLAIYPKAASYHSGSHEIVLRYDFIFLDSHHERADRFF
ncbi:MAG: hypothetical protein R6U86_00415, partial [Bacteroidales bacterium]